jgi:hypothetical protein
MRAMIFSLAEVPRRKSAAFYGKLSSDRRSTCLRSPLPLLVARIRTDHIHHSPTTHDLAVLADLLN